MISYSWPWNLAGGILLALVAAAATMEAKSSSLIPKSLLLWPALLVAFGVLTFLQGMALYGFDIITVFFGFFLILCGLQAAFVNIRRLTPWPSGAIWLTLVVAGLGFQLFPWFEQRLLGFLWMAVGLSKVMRERSAAIEGGTPSWIQLLYVTAILMASYR